MSHRIKCLLGCALLALLLGGRLVLAAPADSPPPAPLGQKVLPPLQGGLWDDTFLGWDYLACPDTVDVGESSLTIKFHELLDWEQTWTAHFGSGAFYHTVAISDSVQLARAPQIDQYYTTGVYTATVFDAGRPVNWAWARWSYSGLPEEVSIEWRTGHTARPDASWSAWVPPVLGMPQSYCCVYIHTEDWTDCSSQLPGVGSSRYLQYRATFHSEDSRRTVALWDMTLTYGTHYAQGTAVSIPLAPIDARAWQTVVYSATVPSGATLQVDILDGASDCAAPVLLADVKPGASLAGIDPAQHRSLRLRATMRTTDPSLAPTLDTWGLRWEVGGRLYMPLAMKE
jgi:hypothetical protein